VGEAGEALAFPGQQSRLLGERLLVAVQPHHLRSMP